MPSADESPGLYVHVPFCVTKCRYCGFFSETDRTDRSGWVEAVLKEAAVFRERFDAFDTVYLGGGTPSVLDDEDLARLLNGLREILPVRTSAEVTVELNPGDVSVARARRWMRMGMSRASVGVQSFDDEALRFLGRRHDADTAWRVLGDLRGAGFDSIGLDLIWGVPGQALSGALASLERALDFSPEHLSCYELTVEAETPLARDVERGVVVPVGDDASFEAATAFWSRLEDAGYEHYEISNFARSRAHRSRHNAKYWRHVPYLGLGPSAHSFDGRKRWANVRSVAGYRTALEAGRPPLDFEETLTERQLRFEQVALGIRTSDGFERSLVDDARLAAPLRQGWIELRGERVVPTVRGMLVADALALELVDG